MDDPIGFALRLLEFVEDSINEALSDRGSRKSSLSEADHAVAVLEKTLRDDQKRSLQLSIMGFFNGDLQSLADLDDAAFLEGLNKMQEKVSAAKRVF